MNKTIEYYRLENSLNESIFNNDVNIDDLLLEMLSCKLDDGKYTTISLLENSTMCDIFNEYIPLIESVDEIANAKNDISKFKEIPNEEKVNFFNKCVQSAKKAVDWWYKIEPDKKFKTLHVILKIVVAIIMIYVNIKISRYVTASVVGSKIVSNIPDKLIKFGKKSNFSISIKFEIISSLLLPVIGSITNIIPALSNKIKYKVNEKDIDRNIKEFDKSIDEINNKISSKDLSEEDKKNLIDSRIKLEKCLAQLIRLKDK